jgi:hypothetical protein
MKRTLILIAVTALAVSAFAEGGAGGASLGFGYQFSNSDAAIATAEAMGLEVENTPVLMLDIHGWSVLNKFMRLGGLISGGYFDAKGKPNEATMSEDEAGVGFGDARVAILPEVYVNFGPIETAVGFAVGGGSIITFVNDDNGDNDGDMVFYGFMRPQVTASYDFGPLGVQVGAGYHLPFAGAEGDFWFNNSAGDTVSNTFEVGEMDGFFVKLDIFFGQKSMDK